MQSENCLISLDGLDGLDKKNILSFWSEHQDGLFQSYKWLEVFNKSYQKRAFVFKAADHSGIIGIIPLIKFGNKYISLPFIDYTNPVCMKKNRGLAAERFLNLSKENFFHFILRADENLFSQEELELDFSNVTFRLKLSINVDDTWKRLSDKVKNQIRKSEKHGVELRVDTQYIEPFYKLWAKHISELGTPPHSYNFFLEIFNLFPPAERDLITAWKDGVLIGGLILMFDSNRAYVPWASSLNEYKRLCTNHALYWKAIQCSVKRKIEEFDFLRSQNNSGTYHFKKQWGAVEIPLYYYSNKFKGIDIPKDSKLMAFGSEIWKRMPFAITKNLGPLLRKNIP